MRKSEQQTSFVALTLFVAITGSACGDDGRGNRGGVGGSTGAASDVGGGASEPGVGGGSPDARECHGDAYTRTDIGNRPDRGTALCLDGASSFLCTWGSPDPAVDGYRVEGEHDGTLLTLHLPRDVSNTVTDPFDFVTDFSFAPSPDLLLTFEDERTGEYMAVDDWAAATAGDQGVCNGAAAECGGAGRFVRRAAGTPAKWDDEVEDSHTGATWNYGTARASGLFPPCDDGFLPPDAECCESTTSWDAGTDYHVACSFDGAAAFCATSGARLPTRADVESISPHLPCAIAQIYYDSWTSTPAAEEGYVYKLGYTGVLSEDGVARVASSVTTLGVLCVR